MFSTLKSLMKIGFFSYGGGNAIIPFFNKEFVGTGRISEDDFNRNVLLTNVTPGTAQVKMASSSAYSQGALASVLSAYAISMPSFFLIIILLSLYTTLSLSVVDQINQFSVGIYVFVAFMLIKYIFGGFQSVNNQDRKLTWAILVITVLLTFGKELSEFISYFISESNLVSSLEKISVEYIYIFLGSFIFALLLSKGEKEENEVLLTSAEFKYPIKMLVIFASIGFIALLPTLYYNLGSYFLSVFASTITSFGGGSAYVSVAESFFVQTGMIPEEYFYGIILIVAYALPGPTLTKVVSGIGFYIGYQSGGIFAGIVVAFASLALSIFATNLIFVFAQWTYCRYAQASFFENLRKIITPVIYGVLVVTTISIINLIIDILLENGFTAFGSISFIVVSLLLVFVTSTLLRVNDILLFLMCGLFSFVVINVF